MQEEVEQKTINLAVTVTKFSWRVRLTAITTVEPVIVIIPVSVARPFLRAITARMNRKTM